MNRRPSSQAAALSLLASLSCLACITINVYFPEAAVRDLSEQIEEQVRERAGELETPSTGAAAVEVEEGAPPLPSEGSERPLRLAILSKSPGVPRADVTSPSIERIIEARARRLADLNRFKDAEVLGEGRDGLVVLRSLDPVSDLRDRALVQRLVQEENADRERLFGEIAAIKDVDRSQLPRIRETYAETLRAQARPGDWIERPDGQWERKAAN